MKRLIIFACCYLLAGCTTVGPVQKRAAQIRIPEVDFRNAPLADVIIFLVDQVNRPAPPRGSIGLIQAPDPNAKQRTRTQFPEFYDLCEDKTIQINVPYCSLLDLLAFVTSCAELDVEFRNDQLVVITKDGKVVMK